MIIKFGIPIVAALALGFGVATTMLLDRKEELASPLNSPAVTTLPGATVAGLGIVEPKSECIAIGTSLSGIVAKVHVVPGQLVKQDEPLFRLDDRELRAELVVRQKTWELERAKLARLRASPRAEDLPPARHRIAAATANLEQSRDEWRRAEKLLESRAIATEDAQSRQYALRVANAELSRAQAELARLEAGSWNQDIAVAEQEVALAKTAVDRVETDLNRLVVTAPIDGIVLEVNVHPGEYAASGPAVEPLLSLGDRGPQRVRVQVDEEDALRIAPGQVAEGYVRGRVRQKLDLRFVRIEPGVKPKQSLSGSTTERVDTRVLTVLYEISASPKPVYVGQQVDVFIGNQTELSQ